MSQNPLQDLFLRAWTTEGFATKFAAAPHDELAKLGLGVAKNVKVAAFGWRSAARHLCPYCQLAIPGVYANVRKLRRARPSHSALDAIFASSSDPDFMKRAKKDGRALLAELGLPVTANVRVKIVTKNASSLELQLCEAHHACVCPTPELMPIVFRNWQA